MRLCVVDHRAPTHVAIRRVDESQLYERWSPEDYERAYGPWAARRRRW